MDHPIFCDVQQRLNDPATGSVGNNHRLSVRLQFLELERRHLHEAMSPVGRDSSLTMDDLATSAGALDHSVRAVHPNNLIDTGSAVSIQPIHRDGHRVTGRHLSPTYLPLVSRVRTASVNII
jgi:hypothetical protein